MKIGVFYSIYSCDDVECSIMYLTRIAYTIKYYMRNKMWEQFDMIICIDNFTKKILKDILQQEVIDDKNIIYRMHERNSGSRGMFWRFESFVNTDYDICVNAEGDNAPDAFFKELCYFICQQDCPMLLNVVRRSAVNENCFDGGRIFIHPKLIDESLRNKFKSLLELFDNIDTIDYGVDERFMHMFIDKHLKDANLQFCIYPVTKIKDEILDVADETNAIKQIYKNAKVVMKDVFEQLSYEQAFDKKIDVPLKLKYLSKIDGNEFYFYNKQFLRIKAPHKPRKSEFCQQRLLNLINPII